LGTRNRKKGRKKNQKEKQQSQSNSLEQLLSTDNDGQNSQGSHTDLSSDMAIPKHLQQMTPPWHNLYALIQKELSKNNFS
jgi:hypothetical protein